MRNGDLPKPSPLDLTSLPKELKLLLAIVSKINGEIISETSQGIFADINWGQFLELATHHRLYPMVYKRLTALNFAELGVPQYVMDILRRDYRRNTFQMLQLSGEMESVCRLLREHQIRSIFLKGPALANVLYGDVSLRTSCDIDILVSILDLKHAEELLTAHGYKKDEYFQTVLGDWKWRHHHTTFFHTGKGIKLEIHWRLNPGPSKEPGFRKLWERRRESSLTSYPVYILGKEDLFLFLVSHGARHGWSRLRWLADIDKISSQNINWIELKKLLLNNQYLHIGGQALILAGQLFHTPLTDQMKTIIIGSRPTQLAQGAMFYVRQMVNLHTTPVPEDISRYHRRHLFALMSLRQKIWFTLSLLYPYPEDAEMLPLPQKLHFLYFPLRPFVWIWRKTRKQHLL